MKIKILERGIYPFSDDVEFPFVVEAILDDAGDAHVSGLELHKVDSEAFDNDNFMYFFDSDYCGFEVLS